VTSFKDLYNWYSDISYKYNFKFADNGWFGLYGITYKDNVPVASKLYVNIEAPIKEEDFPGINNLNLYSHLVQHADSDRCLNNCIALKRYSDKIETYFHIKFKDNYKFAGNDIIGNIELSKYRQGVSVEDKVRRYYYITDTDDIQQILRIVDLDQDEKKVKYLEVTVDPIKCIVIFSDNDTALVNQIIDKNCSKKIINDVTRHRDLFNISPCLFGKYANENVKTVYWDLTTKNFFPNSKLYNYIIS